MQGHIARGVRATRPLVARNRGRGAQGRNRGKLIPAFIFFIEYGCGDNVFAYSFSVGLYKMRQLFLTASVLLLTACDIFYGVRRSASLQVDPTPECVEKVLRNTSGISSVEHEQVDGGRPITFSGIHPDTIVQNFFYKGPNHVSGVLQYTKDYDGNLEF